MLINNKPAFNGHYEHIVKSMVRFDTAELAAIYSMYKDDPIISRVEALELHSLIICQGLTIR